MNIFVLDKNIEKCAQFHCDQHVIKMILESAQILCTTLNKLGFDTPYKTTHEKHPCVLWTGKSYSNFIWLSNLAYALNEEYKYRYKKNIDHRSINVIQQIQKSKYSDSGLTEFVQAMPDKYQVPHDPVTAYRNFYNYDKSKFATWTRRQEPYWFKRLNKK